MPNRILEFFFFFNDTATTEIYTLSLHDALPIYHHAGEHRRVPRGAARDQHDALDGLHRRDRKSTRLNSSHLVISYAVFCLKKKINMAIDHENFFTLGYPLHVVSPAPALIQCFEP